THTLPPSDTNANAEIRPLDGTTYPYGDLQLYRKDGWGWSNGIQAELNKRHSKGVSYGVMYMFVNSTKAANHGWYYDSAVEPVPSFLPTPVPADRKARMRLLMYARDTTVPQHEIRWNFLVDLPFGKGKFIGKNAHGVVDKLIGGWQVSSS